ncbi:AI-2E family transporter [Enterococcus sp. LJL120]
MFDKFRQSKLFFWSVEMLVVATLIFVLANLNFLYGPIGTFFSTLFAPLLTAGFLYYLLNPVVELLEKFHIKRTLAVVIMLLVLLGAIILILFSVIPSLINQLAQLSASLPSFIRQLETWVNDFASTPLMQNLDLSSYLDQLNLSYGSIIQQFVSSLSSSLGSLVSAIASATVLIITVPFVLFYMLKDGKRFAPSIQKVFPEKRQTQIMELLGQLNKTLSNYISGQAIECLFVGTFTFLGYWLIGVDYAFLFGVIAGLTNLIPYLGPYIGLAPAVVVTVFDSPIRALLCCVVVLIVQQVDGNVIYPNVIGKSLAIHPLTIILILLVAGNLAGLLGIFLGVPFYAICRTIVIFVIRMFRDSKTKQAADQIQL